MATWTDYETAWAAVRRGIYDGVGFMLHGLPSEFFAAIDFDHVPDRKTGALLPWVQAIVDANPGGYYEVTPSGVGIRSLGTDDGIDTIHTRGPHPEGGSFELFVCCARYITVSGQLLDPDADNELRDIGTAIEALAKLGKPEGPQPTTSNGQQGPIRLEDLSAKIVDLITSATVDGKPVDHPGAKLLEVSNYLKKRGCTFEASLALLDAHPDGVASKFSRQNRLEKEFRRAWEKGEAPEEKLEPPTEWPEPLDLFGDLLGPPELKRAHLPEALSGFVFDTAARQGTDPSAVALAAVVTCAAAISGDWVIQPKQHDDTRIEQALLWGLILGIASVLKTPILRAATAPIVKLEAKNREAHVESLQHYKKQLAEWKKAGADPSTEPPYPRLPRYLIESTTVATPRRGDPPPRKSRLRREPAPRLRSRADTKSQLEC